MYGWDSYFIVVGLLRDGRLDLARDMVNNFLFEIDHYGAVLNANRTYYLTRSQPPFLSSMVLAVYETHKAAGKDDKQWLARTHEHNSRRHHRWTHRRKTGRHTCPPHHSHFGASP